MTKINCIIIDNSLEAQITLENHIKRIPSFNLVAKCCSAFEAFECIRQNSIDLLFLNINLPSVNGIELIKTLEQKPMFVFVTSQREYAVEAFELNALDYVLKPIKFERFLKTAHKALNLYALQNKCIMTPTPEAPKTEIPKQDYFFVKADYKDRKINFDDILYIEGMKDYVKIHLANKAKPIITHNSLKNIMLSLEDASFVRVHKSFIVSIHHIKSITKNRIIIEDQWIPIGDNYKQEFLEMIK